MPFLAAGALLGGAAGAAGVGGMTLAGGLAAGTALGSAVQGQQDAKKASGLASQAGQAAQVDINALNEQTKAIARQNALDSAELERQLTPEVPLLRTAANEAILRDLQNPSGALAEATLSAGLTDTVQTPLLRAAIEKARANLALGGQLSPDVQNAVSNRALATAGTVAPGGLELGRDLVPRDLGLTSLDLENQRLSQAAQLGGQEANLEFANAQNLLNKIQLLNAINSQRYGQNLAAGQYGQSIQQPLVGLDPSTAGNIAMANAGNMGAALANQANIAGQQSQGYQKLVGMGLQALLQANAGSSPVAAATSPTVPMYLQPNSAYAGNPYSVIPSTFSYGGK